MRYQFETVISPSGHSFKTENVFGPTVDCVFHVHPELELTYVESSFGVRFIGDNISEFRENDLVLVGSMLPHHYMNSPQDSLGPDWSRLKVVKFRDDFAGQGLFETAELSEVKEMLTEADQGLVFGDETATELRPLLYGLFQTDGPMRVIKLLELLAELAASNYTRLSTNLSRAGKFVPDERMERVLDFIHAAIEGDRELSLVIVAEVACMTPQAFSRYFRQSTRKRFIDYVTELKIGRACGLLAKSDLPVIDVAQAAGFRNLSNFNRHFARLKQLSPREYRKLIRDH